jgi:hypothetical protein
MVFTNLSAQNEDDALRYSRLIPVGSARFASMAGAFGALGGDLTCASFNPAGIGVFRSNQMTFSPSLSMYKGKSVYYGEESNTSKNNFGLSNIGFVVVIPNSNNGYLNFAFTYNQLAGYNRSIVINGFNSHSSMLDQPTLNANQTNELDLWGPGKANLIYDNPNNTDPNKIDYINDYQWVKINNSLDNTPYGSNQKKIIQSSGYAGEYAFSISGNINDKIYIGGTVGLLHLKYKEFSEYTETPDVENIDLIRFKKIDDFNTTGNGFNLKVGIIYKVNDFIRLGGALHTPTVYNMSDNYYYGVESRIRYTNGIGDTTVYSPDSYYDYELSTPFKAILSTAFIFQKIGSLSVDYEYIDYRLSSLSADDYTYEDVNNIITDIYRATNNVRVGGEIRLGPASFRGGFAYYGSPYNSDQPNKAANYLIYSGGVGFKAKEAYIDFGFSHSVMDEKYFLYSEGDSRSDINNIRNTFITTIGFKF